MAIFRTKLAIILVNSKLNDDDMRNQDLDVEESNLDPTDCMIVPRPSFVLLPSVDPTNTDSMEPSEAKNLSQLFVLSPYVKPTNDDLIDDCAYTLT
jgi:hypothetical protein